MSAPSAGGAQRAQRAHEHDLGPLRHSHAFGEAGSGQRERALTLVVALTLVTMVVELGVGWWTRSLALTADGWHMGTHALALGGAVLAYRLSARAAGRAGYAFGGWKIEVLAAYTSGLALLAVALMLVVEALQALAAPRTIAYGEAGAVAAVGLVVNLASAWLLARAAVPHAHGSGHGQAAAHDRDHAHADAHGHPHGPADGHAHGHGHDHNFSAAYLHVIADAVTSVLALLALAGGAWFGWAWLDPAVALVGAAVIGQWSLGVLRASARALVDATVDPKLAQRVRELIETDGDAKVADLHVWQVGPRAWCASLAVVADVPRPAAEYRARLDTIDQLRHLTVEVHACPGGR